MINLAGTIVLKVCIQSLTPINQCSAPDSEIRKKILAFRGFGIKLQHSIFY